MKNTDIMEALGDVPEDLVLSALHPADDLTAEPDGREQIIMTNEPENKGRTRRLWLRGGIAAAIAGVLLAGNLALLYSLGKIGKSNSSVSETTVSAPANTTEATTETTETAKETTESTTTTADPNKVTVPNFYGMDYDEAVKLAESCGLRLSIVDDPDVRPMTIWHQYIDPDEKVDNGSLISVLAAIPRYKFDKDGKPVRIDYRAFDPAIDIPAHILTDGQYQFQTRGNSLYRTDNDQLIVTVDDPQQYLHEDYRDRQTAVEFDSIQAVGTDWYLITSSLYFMDEYAENGDWQPSAGPGFWYNRKTGASEPAVFTLKSSDLNIKPEWDDAYWNDVFDYDDHGVYSLTRSINIYDHAAAAPDGSGVYIIEFESFIVHVPTPGNGKLRIYETDTDISNYFSVTEVMTRENGKVLFSVRYNGNDDPYPRISFLSDDTDEASVDEDSGLFELDPKNGSIRTIRNKINIDMFRIDKKLFCILYGYEVNGAVIHQTSELAEYLPESRSFRTIADLEKIGWIVGFSSYYNEEDNISNDAVILHPWLDGDDFEKRDLLVSLKDGKITELK